MKGEFSRLSFDPRQHYAGVLQQQGRVGLDSDWNEWVAIVLRRLDILARDTIGGCGRPKHAPGFEITVDTTVTPPDVWISDGRLYAGGMLAESQSAGHKGTHFSAQADWLFPAKAAWTTLFPAGPAWPGLDFTSVTPKAGMTQLIYAEVWLRHVTALNDEAARDEAFNDAGGNPDWTARPEVGDQIRERALGGPDSCTRLQTVAQVKHWDNLDPKIQTCEQACAALAKALPPKTIGAMQLDVTPTPPVTDPCQEPLQGGYGGAWNRTYRVEIHDDGAAGAATFKWSTENGAFTVRINGTALTNAAAGTDIVITSIGNDQETQLSANDWVEVCGEETELGVFRNALAQVKSTPVSNTDGTWTVQLTGAAVIPHAPFLRRWSANIQTIQLNQQFNLDAGSGLGVTFFDAAGGNGGKTYFHGQDYWTWSARVDIRAVEPATLTHVPQPPQGIERHYCCLALLTWQNQNQTVVNTANTMCTPIFPPLTGIPVGECGCCCVISVGDGVLTHGDFDSLTDAFASLPDTGKRGAIVICIEEGVHTVPQPINLTQDRVIIRGCGLNTFIEAPLGAFILESRRQVTFSNLVIESQTAPAITAHNVHKLEILDSRIHLSLSKTPVTGGAAPAPGQNIHNSFRNLSTPALVLQGWVIDILRNEIRGSVIGGGIAILPGSGDINIDGNSIHKSTLAGVDFGFALSIGQAEWLAYRVNAAGAAFERIRISDNSFTDINAPAILQASKLTALPYQLKAQEAAPQAAKSKKGLASATQYDIIKLENPPVPLIADLTIEDNLITHCGLGSTIELRGESESAQKTAAKLAAAQQANTPDPEAAIQLYAVERLEISRNRIVRNGDRNPVYAGILIAMSEGLVLRQNVISENGRLVKLVNANSGGVILQMAIPEIAKQRRESAGDAEGWAALVVEDNVIDSLNGPALRVIGVGSMRIRGNTLTNRHTAASTLQACLILANLGSTDESLLPLGLFGAFSNASVDTRLLPLSRLTDFGGLTMIAGNQIVTVGDTKSRGPAALVFSGDDLSFTDNQVRVKTTAEMTFNTLAYAYTLRVLGNRFSEPVDKALVSCLGDGGMVTGASNQATHCLVFSGTLSTVTGLNSVNPQFSQPCELLSAAGLSQQSASKDVTQGLKNITAARQQMNSFQLTTLDQAHAALAQRATDLTQAPKGEKAPVPLQTRAALYNALAVPLQDTRLASIQVPQPSDATFVVYGRVLTAAGAPGPDLTVSLSDPKGIANRVPPVTTDANGYFTMTLRTAEFPDLTAATSQMFVSVTDAKQREIAKPTQAITYQPGQVAIMPIER